MRLSSLSALIIMTAALGGCAGTIGPQTAAGPEPAADLDTLMYANAAPKDVNTRGPAIIPVAASKEPAGNERMAADSTATGAFAADPVVSTSVVVSPEAAFADEPPYTLDTGDRLRVVVFGQDGLSNSYSVDSRGFITMPLVRAISARGLTTEQLAHAIASRLRNGFVREPHVAVEVEIYRPFFILGEVALPGQYAYVPHMTVENAVAIAGGFTPRAYRWDVRIDRPVEGGVIRKSVPPITRVRPGDTIKVKERWF
jgi:polysaccharide export outer membrane protein